ncbi:hypothetical protein ACFLZH_00730 [Patescibacteria group bacterium]
MCKKLAYLTGFLAVVAIAAITLFAMPMSAEHAEELHEAKYYGAAGEVLKGQVTVLNPTNETKIILAEIEEEGHHKWLFLPQDEFTIGPGSKVVVQYEVRIPHDMEEPTCQRIIHIKETSPSNTLSLKHTVTIFVQGVSTLRGATEVNMLYTTVTIMMIVAFALGISMGGICCLKLLMQKINGKKKARKRKK